MDHYLQSTFEQRARRGSVHFILPHPTTSKHPSGRRSTPTQPPPSCLKVSLSCQKYDNGAVTLHALLDTCGIPIVFLTAINRFQQHFHMVTSFDEFIAHTAPPPPMPSRHTPTDPSDARVEQTFDHALPMQSNTSIGRKNRLEKKFLRHTPNLCTRLAVVAGTLIWTTVEDNATTRDQGRYMAAVKIQAMVRGHVYRLKVYCKRIRQDSVFIHRQWYKEQYKTNVLDWGGKRKLNNLPNGSKAATHIQTLVRTHQQRHKTMWRKKKKERTRQRNKEKYLEQLREREQLEDALDVAEDATVSIQSRVRGNSIREEGQIAEHFAERIVGEVCGGEGGEGEEKEGTSVD
jgi:hypothetical protein